MEIPFSIRYNNIKLKVERLYKTSNQPGKSLFPGIEDVSFELKGGECIHLKSPGPWMNTLLLESLAGRTSIDAGAIWVAHQDRWLNLHQVSQRQISQIQAQTIGYLAPSETLRSQATVIDCVLTKLLCLGLSRTQAESHSRHVLDWMGIPRRLWHQAPGDLPLATLHQVNLASTFAVDYSIIIIALPLSQLDPASQTRLLELIDYRKAKDTCFIGRFDQDDLRYRVCDRSLSIHAPTPISINKPHPAKKRTVPTPAAIGSKADRWY